MRHTILPKLLSVLTCITFLWAQEDTLPSIFIDVNQCRFTESIAGEKIPLAPQPEKMRIVVFNVQEQKYEHIHYYGLPRRLEPQEIATLTATLVQPKNPPQKRSRRKRHTPPIAPSSASYALSLQPLPPYSSQPSLTQRALSQTTSEEQKRPEENHIIRFFSDGSVNLPIDFPENIILRTHASTQLLPSSTDALQKWTQLPWTFRDLRLNNQSKKSQAKTPPKITMQLTYKGTLNSITPQEMLDRLPTQKGIRYGKNFHANHFLHNVRTYGEKLGCRPSWTFQDLNHLGHSQGRELGYLGELCVEMTCISYGYMTRHTSQNRSNHGLDGIFTNDLDSSHILITESKGQSETGKKTSAKNILETELNEAGKKGIYDSLQEMMKNPILKASADLVREYIHATPNHVFKLAHRLKKDGTCQYAGDILNKKVYMEQLHTLVTPDSPIEEKSAALSDTLDTLCRTPKDKIALLKEILKSDPNLSRYILLPSPPESSPLKPKKLSFNQAKNLTDNIDENKENITITLPKKTARSKKVTAQKVINSQSTTTSKQALKPKGTKPKTVSTRAKKAVYRR